VLLLADGVYLVVFILTLVELARFRSGTLSARKRADVGDGRYI